MIENKKIFITGGAGFIGGVLAERLYEKNQVCIFDNFSRTSLEHKSSLKHKNITLIEGDVTNKELLENQVREFQPTHVVHCAAIAGINTVIKNPVKTMKVNILGTAFLLDALKNIDQLERVVLFSTSEIFGQKAFQSSEMHSAVIGPVGEARWTYAVSKLTDEHFSFAYYKEFGMPCTIVRPFNVYGPGQIGEGALSIFIQRALLNEKIEIHNDGTQIRAWCYVDDMVDGVMKCLSNPKAVGEAFNIGNIRTASTIYGLAQTVCRILKSNSKVLFSGRKFADVELRIPDITKAKNILDFEAKVDLDQGIPLTADYYRNVLSV